MAQEISGNKIGIWQPEDDCNDVDMDLGQEYGHHEAEACRFYALPDRADFFSNGNFMSSGEKDNSDDAAKILMYRWHKYADEVNKVLHTMIADTEKVDISEEQCNDLIEWFFKLPYKPNLEWAKIDNEQVRHKWINHLWNNWWIQVESIFAKLKDILESCDPLPESKWDISPPDDISLDNYLRPTQVAPLLRVLMRINNIIIDEQDYGSHDTLVAAMQNLGLKA